MAKARDDALAAIVTSNAARKLVVAGPGTGKTHTFLQLLSGTGDNNLALTFLRNLVSDLEDGLQGVAAVYSFHGFAHLMLRETDVPGITKSVDYYPALEQIFAEDVGLLGTPATQEELQEIIMNLRTQRQELAHLIQAGDYYDAVGYNDSVLRIHQHYGSSPDDIPAYTQIVVDEYQDFSLLETELIDLLGDRSPLLVAGDDDQALYQFRHASAIYLRALAEDDRFQRFELPFCSRCTTVLVDATHVVVAEAQARGLLSHRLAKPYVCYRPTKSLDSDTYPKITHAHCTVHTTRAPYIAKYVAESIRSIPDEEITAANLDGHPSVLVIGPNPFAFQTFEYLENEFTNVEFKASTRLEVSPIDGYLRLLKNQESRLAWRILLYTDRPPGHRDAVAQALTTDAELCELLPEAFRQAQLQVVEILGRIRDGNATPGEITEALAATGLSLEALLTALGIESISDDEIPGVELTKDVTASPPVEPKIVVTTLSGSKGLQSDHVFIVGVNARHFPRSGTAPTEGEVCQLLVALTRARKSCTLVSTRRFGHVLLGRSLFVDWLAPFIQNVTVNRDFFA